MAASLTPKTTYKGRAFPARPSDLFTTWEPVIAGQRYECARVAWAGGRQGYTVTIRLAGAAEILHKFEFTAEGDWVAS